MTIEKCMHCGIEKELGYDSELAINDIRKKVVLCEDCAVIFLQTIDRHPPLSELLSFIGYTKESFFKG